MNAIISREWASNQYSLRVKSRWGRVSKYLEGAFEWKSIEDNGEAPKILFEEEDAKEIAYAIYLAAIEARLLPDQSKIEGELIATKKHLEDLQKAFNKMVERFGHI
jgi:hypothetical protein